jgi:hypothetical protein
MKWVLENYVQGTSNGLEDVFQAQVTSIFFPFSDIVLTYFRLASDKPNF